MCHYYTINYFSANESTVTVSISSLRKSMTLNCHRVASYLHQVLTFAINKYGLRFAYISYI